MLPYRYPALPLPEAGKHVRLLKLSPGGFSDNLHVELEQVLLGGTSNYEALSYVWGSTAHPVSILVGPSRERTISVTQNLSTALRYLRDANESRILWVDAICINQNDLKERSDQVALMSDIYRAACQVIVWLGPEEDDSSHAFDIMHAIGLSIDVDWVSNSYKPKVAVNNQLFRMVEDRQNYRFQDKEAIAINRLLHRQWFERLWIRQEIGLATQAIIRCGSLSILWHLFRDAIFFMYVRGTRLVKGALKDQRPRYQYRMQLVYSVCLPRVYYLQYLRSDLGQVVCTDPRDKIYAMLSLLHPSQQTMGIVPDYTRDVALVYQDTAIRFMDYTRNLSILLQCELLDTPPHMPTWVPDWSTELKAEQFLAGSSNASAGFKSIAASKGEGMLSVAGVAIATIEGVQPMQFVDAEDEFQNMLTALWRIVISNPATSNDKEISRLSAMCDALCCGAFRHSTIPVREDLPEFKSTMRTFKSILRTTSPSVEDLDSVSHWNTYKAWVKDRCRNRSFFVTTEGSVGIAPLSARPGDAVCVLLGCWSTILLRQTKDDTYQVVGQLYMPGVNAGEALVGPLPEHLRLVEYSDEEGEGFTLAYRNDRTEEVQFQDPRLDKLLLNPGFEVHDHGHNSFPTIETSVEALRNAGIAAQYFDLV